MARIESLPAASSDTWRFALLGGLASLPFTTASYWQTGSELSLSPVFFGGLLAAYLARRKHGTAKGVGLRAGLIGGLPGLWVLYDVLVAATALSGPPWFMAAGVVMTALFLMTVAVLAFGLSALVGAVGGRVGGWLAGETGGGGSSVARS